MELSFLDTLGWHKNFKRERTGFAYLTHSDKVAFRFVFSAKTTVQWYFIVGPLLAVTVLVFIVLKLWKRRIAGTYTVNFASFIGPYEHNKIRSTELKMKCGCGMKVERDK